MLSSALALTLVCQAPAVSQEPPGPLSPEERQLAGALAEKDVHIDPRRGTVAIPVDVGVRDDLLEYLLVGPAGATHESLFFTPVQASVLNVALLALGLEPGSNASWAPLDPMPSDEELRAGARPYSVSVPEGDALHVYVAWRQASGERYFYRVEDLLRNLLTGHSMQRHEWVYLGSRMVPPLPRRGEQPAPEFAADVYQNLINIAFFREGYTLLTAALADCVEQTVWIANAWLVPERGTRVMMIFSREHLAVCPEELAEHLPLVEPSARDARTGDR